LEDTNYYWQLFVNLKHKSTQLMTLEKIALIVAGGTGKRMKSQIPKQFLLLNGRPVLMHTLYKFYRYDTGMRIILVLPEDEVIAWKGLCAIHGFAIKHEIGTGGETRFHSIRRNLDNIPEDCLVAVHDGVRPLVSQDTIHRCFVIAAEKGNAVPCIEIPESLRIVDELGNRPADRTIYRLIQTPQVFNSSLLKESYHQEYHPSFTDDASVVESMGCKINLVDGNPENLKITLPQDLGIAEFLLKAMEGDQYHL
jgi:2-C-methyl-D-erythritol 4-phosphate cytidylyltransferase